MEAGKYKKKCSNMTKVACVDAYLQSNATLSKNVNKNFWETQKIVVNTKKILNPGNLFCLNTL
jgi:hypothetical protein